MSIDRTKYLDEREVKVLRTVTEAKAITDLRAGRQTGVTNWMIVDLALSTGLRVSEMVAIKHKDIDLRRNAISVVRLKRKKKITESLAIGKELAKHLQEYIDWKGYADKPTKPSSALLTGKRGDLTAQGLQQIWKRCIAEAGLPKELSIHCARHTVATHLLKKTNNLRQVQKQLGHASPTTTANMYADVSFEDMQDGMNGLYT